MIARLRARIAVPRAQRDQREDLARARSCRSTCSAWPVRACAGQSRSRQAIQPIRRPGQPVGLGHHVQRQRRRRQVRGLRQRRGRVELQPAVDLVAEQQRCRARRTTAPAVSRSARSGTAPVGLFGKFTDTSRVVGRSCRSISSTSSAQPSSGRSATPVTSQIEAGSSRPPGSSASARHAWSPGSSSVCIAR